MSGFYVGQRVRMARPVHSRNLGMTGIIRELWPIELMADLGPVNCSVNWDNGIVDRSFCGGFGGKTAAHTSQLETLTTPHEACEPEFKAQLDELLKRLGVEA